MLDINKLHSTNNEKHSKIRTKNNFNQKYQNFTQNFLQFTQRIKNHSKTKNTQFNQRNLKKFPIRKRPKNTKISFKHNLNNKKKIIK